MTQIRWDMLKDRQLIKKNIDRLFDQAFGNPKRPSQELPMKGWMPVDEMFAEENSAELGWRKTRDLHFRQAVDLYNSDPDISIYQRGSELVIDIRLPELIKETLHLDVNDTVLTLRGRQHISVHPDNREVMPWDHKYKTFRKFIALPIAPRQGQVTAEVKGNRIRIRIIGSRN